MSCPKSNAIDLQPHLLKIGEHLLNQPRRSYAFRDLAAQK